MKIINLSNGGAAEVDDEYGEKLVATGTWKNAEAPKRAAAKKPAAKAAETE